MYMKQIISGGITTGCYCEDQMMSLAELIEHVDNVAVKDVSAEGKC